MALISTSVYNVVNKCVDFFTEITDIEYCKDECINMRMRQIMVSNPSITTVISTIIYELVQSMRDNRYYDHYDIEKLDSYRLFPELVSCMAYGWFNYDKYIGQYSEQEIGDLVYLKIQEVIVMEAERIHISTPVDNITDMMTRL